MFNTFFILGSIASFIVWFFQRKKMVRAIKIVIILLIFSLSTILIFYTEPLYLSASKIWYNRSPWFDFLLFSFMILGMIAQYFVSIIEKKRENKENKINFDIWEFSYPMFFSVFTFSYLIGVLEIKNFNLGNIIIAFQTGFFWQSIVRVQGKNVIQTTIKGNESDEKNT
jgi:hypothetical protein